MRRPRQGQAREPAEGTAKIRRGIGQATKLPDTTEAEVAAQVVAAFAMLGIKLERQNTGGADFGGRHVQFGEKGDPDYRATLPGGRRLGLEIKRPGKRPTPEQLAKLHELNRLGGVGLWTDDGGQMLKLLPRLIAGGWAEIDEDGTPYIAWDEGNKKD
jgi:hypothetical protein